MSISIHLVNGCYDIICAFCILNIIQIPYVKDFHLKMFKSDLNDITKRLLAYWIITYGFIRLVAFSKISYIIEALAIANETFIYKTIHVKSGIFVIFFSLLLLKH